MNKELKVGLIGLDTSHVVAFSHLAAFDEQPRLPALAILVRGPDSSWLASSSTPDVRSGLRLTRRWIAVVTSRG